MNFSTAQNWFKQKKWKPFPFQKKAWESYSKNYSGIVNAPTGSGKTYSLLIPIILEAHQKNKTRKKKKLSALWITPMRSLANEIQQAGKRFSDENNLDISIEIRNGDTTTKQRTKQKKNPPDVLIITPESVHLLLATKEYAKYFNKLEAVVVDEWHELIGSKRGVQVELALSRLKTVQPYLKIWGISATIGNMEEAQNVLLAFSDKEQLIIKSTIKKEIEVIPLLPEDVDKFPWAGHLGLKLLDMLLPIIEKSKTTLVFVNTRAQCEIWYQRLLEAQPDLAGVMALHHGSVGKKIRLWVEEGLRTADLKVVICTSSLDLGVDFAPVESVVQIGSPKGIARFLQRAGRSGHQPGKKSRIYFLPTHGLELIEASALKKAVAENKIESKPPLTLCFDVLIQYLITLAVSDGFYPKNILLEIRKTHCFQTITDEEWSWILNFIVQGSQSLGSYDEFKKVEILSDGLYKVNSRRIAMRHRLNMGTIVSDAVMIVKPLKGKKIGVVEEWFVSNLNVGDVFWFAGRCLKLDKIHNNEILVKKVKPQKGKIPSWQGGRMPLSSQLTETFREQLLEADKEETTDKALQSIQPILEVQKKRSEIPNLNEFLVERFPSRDGFHTVFYPFEGRLVNEALASLISYRISNNISISFSIAFNDYGFELLSDQPIPLELIDPFLFEDDSLLQDLQASMNATEMARRKFRDISVISGLIFNGYPGKQKKDRHLQASAKLFFDVFQDIEKDNLLLRQAIDETFNAQIEEVRLRKALERIRSQKLLIAESEKPTPFAFPIMIERTRAKLSSESLLERIEKMQIQFE